MENAVPTKIGAGAVQHPDCLQDLRRRRRSARAVDNARSRSRKAGRSRRGLGIDRSDQTGGKELGKRIVARRSVQIAIEGKAIMGRKEKIAVSRQIEENVFIADPTVVKTWAQVK